MENYVLVIVPLVSGLLAQFIKFVIFSLKHGMDWRFLFEYGHMPSSHTAMMSALICAIGFREGVSSPAFAVALIITVLVVSDALRLRMYIGSYGRTLNNLLEHLRIEDDRDSLKLKERVGHRPTEIIAGMFLGIFTAMVLMRLFQILGF